jgi:ubiquinone/menaquinone biosynthesis C-methylase UbiE
MLCYGLYKLLYDVPAEGYRELYGDEQVVKYRVVFNYLGLGFSRVLDIGCGVGLLAGYLEEAGFEGTYIGVDIDYDRVKYAKKNSNRREHTVEYIVADAHHLPFRDKSFQISTSFTVIHLLDIDKAVEEAIRVSQQFIVVTLLKKREDLRKNVVERIQKAGKIIELEDTQSKDYCYIIILD